jgi:HAD superfamily hydrolase (TIGR01458 family)
LVQAILFDMDGVLYEGDGAVPGAAEAVAWFERREIPCLFLTNTTSRPREELVAKLSGLGIDVNSERILTPPVAAVAWLRAHAPGPTALFVPEATAKEFAELESLPAEAETGAGSVVVGDLGEAWDFHTLNRAFRLLMDEARPAFVALGMTRYWRPPDGLRLDVAPFVVALEHASGTHAVVLGKPAPAFFEAALAKLGCEPSQAVLVGDDIVTDVQAAQRAGLRGVLVRTGKFRASDLEGPIRPDAVLESVAELPRWWDGQAAS